MLRKKFLRRKEDKMNYNGELIRIIRLELQRGVKPEFIRQKLFSKGWNISEINRSMNEVLKGASKNNKEPNEKIVSWKVWAILAIAAILIIVVCIIATIDKKEESPETKIENNQNSEVTESIKVKDCEGDFECFLGESQNCNPSKWIREVDIEILGMVTFGKMLYEVKGSKNGKCEFYIEVTEYNVDLTEESKNKMRSDGMNENEIQSYVNTIDQYSDEIEGRSGTCLFNKNSDLTDILEKINNDEFSSEISCSWGTEESECETQSDWDVADCEGNYFSDEL